MDFSRKSSRKAIDEKTGLTGRKESRFKNIVPELFSSEGHVIYFSAFDDLLCTEVLIHRTEQPLTKQMLSEVEMIRRFNHDNIASFYDLVTSSLDNSTYIVSEILDTHLEHVIYSDQMTFSHATLFAYQIIRGLKYMHSANLCHGSLNPSNILISCHDLLLKISGLLTKDEYLDTETGLSYCSPEKLMKLGGEDSISVDIWSAGCIIVEMLLRRKLFRGLNTQDILLKITDAIYLSEDDWSQIFKLIPNKMLKNHPLKPRQPIRMLFSYWDVTVVSLLESMLAFDADQRISSEDVLSYSFFSEYHSPDDEPSVNDDVMQLLERERTSSQSEDDKLLCGSFSMDDIVNVDATVPTGDQVALNNFRNYLERNSPPSVRTPSPNIMDLLQGNPLQKSTSSHFGRNFRGSPSSTSETMQVLTSTLMEKVWNSSLMSISSSSSCNSVNSISCRPSAKELQHKHLSGSDSEKEAAEITDEKLKEDAEINSIVEALRHFRTTVDQSFVPGCITNKNSRNAEVDPESKKAQQISSLFQNLQNSFCSDKIEEEVHSYLDVSSAIQEEQTRREVEKFLAAHGIQGEVCESGVGSLQNGSTTNPSVVKDVARSKEEESNISKKEKGDAAWVPSGKKLLLEQLETEKKAKLWTGCHTYKKHLSSKSKEEEEYIEVGCKLTSSEFDELYRLPTEHLKRDGPSWRRYADDMNHSLTNHHNHYFHNEDGPRSSRLSEGGACGGNDYGSLDDLGSSNMFCNSCTKCDSKISAGPWHRSDLSPEETNSTFKSCPVNRVVCSHKKCFAPKVLSTSSDERHPSPDSPPSSPPFFQSHSGARPKKSRKYFRK